MSNNKLQLGSQGDRRTPLIKGEENIDKGFFLIKFKINGKQFIKAVDDILKFEQEDLEEVSDGELDKALDEVGYYRFSFFSAASEIKMRMLELKRKFQTWQAECRKEARHALLQERKRLRDDEGLSTSFQGSVTKQEIEDWILLHSEYGPELETRSSILDGMEKTYNLLITLRDVCQDRGGHLQSIGKRRLENRKDWGHK